MKNMIIDNTLKAIPADAYRRTLSSYATSNYTAIDTVTFPEGLRSIGADSFNGQNLTEVIIPPTVMMIGNGAFENNNIKNITISSLVKFIGARTFNNNDLTSLFLPDSIRTVGDYAFAGNHIEEISLGKVEKIGQYTFNGNNIRHLEIPDICTEIGTYAFSGNPIENSVKIPASLKSIGSFAFDNDVKLEIEGHTIPAKFICDRNIPGGHLSSTVKLQTIRNFFEKNQNKELTESLVGFLYQSIIENKKIEDIMDKFNVAGDLDVNLLYDDTISEKLENAFVENFRRIPGARKPELKIIESYAIACTQFKITPEEIISKFNFNDFKDNMIDNRKYSNIENIIAMTYLDHNDYNKAVTNGSITNVAKILLSYIENNKDENYMRAALWAIDHPTANDNLLAIVTNHAKEYDISRSDSTEVIYTKQAQFASSTEIRAIEKAYPRFKFTNCTFDLKFSDTTYKDSNHRRTYHMCILRPGDTRMAQIGYDTFCCQHLGGAGETAMMHGLLNPKGGFWIMEDAQTHKILGQAEIWEDTRGRLVFDNIEFANDGDIGMYYNPIGQWLMESGYTDAIMGTGYNELARGMSSLPNCSAVTPWLTHEELYILDRYNEFSSMEEAQRLVEEFSTKSGNYPILLATDKNTRIVRNRYNIGSYYGLVYTDADEHCKVLKENGRVKECLLNEQQIHQQKEKFEVKTQPVKSSMETLNKPEINNPEKADDIVR
jgi:hypothetical protein